MDGSAGGGCTGTAAGATGVSIGVTTTWTVGVGIGVGVSAIVGSANTPGVVPLAVMTTSDSRVTRSTENPIFSVSGILRPPRKM